MDSYRTLIENGKYKIILELTKNAIQIEDIYYRVIALALNEDYNEALDLLNSNKVNFIKDLSWCRKELFTVHIHILKVLNDPASILKELDYYDSLPYLDYEFEEMLKDTKKELMNSLSFNNKFNNKQISENRLNEIGKALDNPSSISDKVLLLEMIDELRNYDIESIIPSIKKFLKSNFDTMYRTYMLLLLVYKGSYEEFEFSKNNIDYVLVPYELDPPFENEYYSKVNELLVTHATNPSILETARSVYNRYILLKYPDNTNEIDEINVALALLIYASSLLNDTFDRNKLNDEDINTTIIEALIDEIKQLMLDDNSNI